MRLFRRNKYKREIRIKFDKRTGNIEISCNPPSTRPTEIIQLLMLAINTINIALQKELKKDKKVQSGKRIYIS